MTGMNWHADVGWHASFHALTGALQPGLDSQKEHSVHTPF